MRFMMMYKPAADESNFPPSPEYLAEMGKLIGEGMKAGTLLYTEGLLPSARGARVSLAAGKLSVTDGPFTESKELVAGFAIIRAESREEAIEQARQFLNVAGDGQCEIRQLVEPSDFQAQ